MNVFSRPVAEWTRVLAPHGAESNVRRTILSLYRLEAEEAWKLPGLGAGLARELERLSVRAVLPRVLRSSTAPCGTEKLLLEIEGGSVEAVLMPVVRKDASKLRMRGPLPGARDLSRRPPRAAGCVSTQVGCGVGCAFCASGLRGLERNLACEEMVGQVLVLRRRARELGYRLATVVFMGTGEPLHNQDQLLAALANLTDRSGGELGPSSITVSTVGVVDGIERLASEGSRAPNLALSLHAPDDETRARLVPLPRLSTVADALRAARDYATRTRRFVTVSYVLLEGVNDSIEQARGLASLLGGSGFHVNLIPWNAVPGLAFAPSPRERAQAFWQELRAGGIACHFRRARGTEAEAACGQLRRLSGARP